MITAKDLGFSYGEGSFALRDITIDIAPGEFVSVTGRNGSGKSTLIKLLTGQRSGYTGSIIFDGREISSYERKEIAAKLAYLPQAVQIVNEDVSLVDMALIGCYWRKGTFDFSVTSRERSFAEAALKELGLSELSRERYGELSGGQKQKALIAVALSQLDITSDLKGKTLLVDEPLTFLDVNHQYEVFGILKKLNERGLTVIAIVHDLNIALRFTEKCILMSGGGIVRQGMTKEVITEAMLKEHFLIDSKITEYEEKYFINYLT